MMSFALSIAVKATVTMTLALLGAWLARGNRAALRHLLLAAGFAVLIALPFTSLVVPTFSVTVAIPMPLPAPVPEIPAPTPGSSSAVDSIDAPPIVQSATPSRPWPSWPALAVAIWVLGVALFIAPVIAGLFQVRALRRASRPWPRGQRFVDQLAADVGLRRHVEMLQHDGLPGPVTCGIIRPAVVVPADADEWNDEDLRRALVHELEHVRRADWASQCVARLVCAAYWFHPLVWIASRRLVLEAERACDDGVLRRPAVASVDDGDATAYADQLVGLARRLSDAPSQAQLAMANRHDLSTRVRAVLDSRQRRGRAGTRWLVFAGALAALFVMTMSPLKVVTIAAQSGSSQAPQAPPQRYEVASIKPCTVDEAPPGPARGTAGGTNASFSPGRMNVPCVTLEQLIYLAYAAYGATESERLANDSFGGPSDATKVRGGPSWVHSQRDKYAVEATAPGATQRTVLLGTMLRALLEERFRLKIHRETEEVPMFELKVAKSGLKLKPMKEGDCVPFDPAMVSREKAMCGMMTSGGRGPNTVWSFTGFPLSSLAGRLSPTLGRHVIDRTGITDSFIFRLTFHPDENTPGIVWPPERDADTSEPAAASVFTALEEQLGLKIEKTRAPRGFLVIDHVERPTSNGGAAFLRR